MEKRPAVVYFTLTTSIVSGLAGAITVESTEPTPQRFYVAAQVQP